MLKKVTLLVVLIVGGFASVNRAQMVQCILDSTGTWHCETIYFGGVLLGYNCTSGSTDGWKCTKPPKDED